MNAPIESHLELIDWSQDGLIVCIQQVQPMPRPGDFLACSNSFGEAFYLQIHRAQLSQSPNHQGQLLLSTTIAKGRADFPVKSCRILDGIGYLKAIHPEQATKNALTIGAVSFSCNDLGHWVYLHNDAQQAVQALYQNEDYPKLTLLTEASLAQWQISSPQNTLWVGKDLHFTLQDIRIDFLVDYLTQDLTESIRPECTRILHEQLGQLSETAGISDLLDTDDWDKTPYAKALRSKLELIAPYFTRPNHKPSKASTAKASTKGKKAKENALPQWVILPNASHDILGILYTCALNHLRQLPTASESAFVLVQPELNEAAVRHFMGMSAHRVFLISQNQLPWADLADDQFLVQPQTQELTVGGKLTGGVAVSFNPQVSHFIDTLLEPHTLESEHSQSHRDSDNFLLDGPIPTDDTRLEEAQPNESLFEETIETPETDLVISLNETDEEEVIDDWSLQNLVSEDAFTDIMDTSAMITASSELTESEPEAAPSTEDNFSALLGDLSSMEDAVASAETVEESVPLEFDTPALASNDDLALSLDEASFDLGQDFDLNFERLETDATVSSDETHETETSLDSVLWLQESENTGFETTELPVMQDLSPSSASSDLQSLASTLSWDDNDENQTQENNLLSDLVLDEPFDSSASMALDSPLESIALDTGTVIDDTAPPVTDTLSSLIHEAAFDQPATGIEHHSETGEHDPLFLSELDFNDLSQDLGDFDQNTDFDVIQQSGFESTQAAEEEFITPIWADTTPSHVESSDESSATEPELQLDLENLNLGAENLDTDWSDLSDLSQLGNLNPSKDTASSASNHPVVKEKPAFETMYQEGQRIHHPSYGEGQIQKVMRMYDDQVVLNIQFEGIGKRLLDPSLCELKSLSAAP